MGGSPLFDERTGKMTDRYAYLKKKFPTQAWAKEDTDSLEIRDQE